MQSSTMINRRYITILYDYLYQNASIYLESKHQKFVDFFSKHAS